MPEEAVVAVVTRGASVLEKNPESRTALEHDAAGLYLQVVGGTPLPKLYVGKSDVSVRKRMKA